MNHRQTASRSFSSHTLERNPSEIQQKQLDKRFQNMIRYNFFMLLAAICIAFSNAFVVSHTKISSVGVTYPRVSEPTTSFPWEKSASSSLAMSAENGGGESKLPFWLDPNTKGGVIVLSIVLFLLPLLGYNIATGILGFDEIEAGKWIGVGFTAIGTVAWVATYIFRVATKDMTYAKQLKDYENAVIAKRLEELDDDEIQALVEEIERDDF